MNERTRRNGRDEPTAARTLRVGQRVWLKRNPSWTGRVIEVKGSARKRYMVRWDCFADDPGYEGSGEYVPSLLLIEAVAR